MLHDFDHDSARNCDGIMDYNGETHWSDCSIGKSSFLHKISPLEGDHQKFSIFCVFLAQACLYDGHGRG